MPAETDIGAQLADLFGQVLANDIVQGLLHGGLVVLAVLWLAAAWWAYRDAASRTGSTLASFGAMAAIVLGGPLLCPLVVLVYLLLRPEDTVAEREERALSVQALEGAVTRPCCPVCDAVVRADWRRCPTCGTWLLQDCARCARPLDPAWVICPWCAFEPAGRLALARPAPVVSEGAVAPVQRGSGTDAAALQRAAAMIRVAARSTATRRATRTTGGR